MSSRMDGTENIERALVASRTCKVDRAVGITEAGGRTKGRPMDRDREGAKSPNPYNGSVSEKV